jgi:hypothetical protein
VTVDMTKLSGKESAVWWFNPRTGESKTGGKVATAGKQQFKPPAEGDWVLVLDDAARNLPAPGAAPVTAATREKQ